MPLGRCPGREKEDGREARDLQGLHLQSGFGVCLGGIPARRIIARRICECEMVHADSELGERCAGRSRLGALFTDS